MRKDVREVIDLCRSLGLDPIMESGSGHHKVRDPKTGVYLFGISSSPSDPNWKWMIMRHLRRLGLLRDPFKRGKSGRAHKRKPAIDLAALKKAQEQAAASGHRIPTLDDLEDSAEFFSRIKTTSGPTYYSDAAQEEAIDIMAAVDAPRISYIKQRLRKQLDAHAAELEKRASDRSMKKIGRALGAGKGARVEFVRIAIEEVASKRGLRSWKSVASGQQTLHNILEKDQKGMQLWVAILLEATMDHIDGLKWGEIDESVKRLPTAPESEFAITKEDAHDVKEEIEIEADSEVRDRIEAEQDEPQWAGDIHVHPIETSTDHIKERYAETLLEILKAEGSDTNESVLARLDKLAGIA